MSMREINCFWKEKWHYEHFHPTIINPVSISPLVLLDEVKKNHDGKDLNAYNSMVRQLVSRLAVESDDENSYRIESRQVKGIF